MKFPTVLRWALGLASLVAAAAAWHVYHRQPLVLRVGMVQPLSGRHALIGRDLLRGAELAARTLNDARLVVHGRPLRVEVVPIDDQGRLDAAADAARQAVASGVSAVIGHLDAELTLAAAPVYAQAGVAQLTLSSDPGFTRLGLATTFRLVASDDLQAQALARTALSQTDNRVMAVLGGEGPDAALPDALANQIEAELRRAGRPPAHVHRPGASAADPAALARLLRDLRVDTLITTWPHARLHPLLQALQTLDHLDLKVLATDRAKTGAVLRMSPQPARGLWVTSPVIDPGAFLQGSGFSADFVTVYGEPALFGAHYTYDAVHVLLEAVRLSGSTDAEDILSVLPRVTGSVPVTTVMRFRRDGEQGFAVMGLYLAAGHAWSLQNQSATW